MRQLVNGEHILHRRDEGRVAIGRDLPVFAQVRLQFVFFSDRCTHCRDVVGNLQLHQLFRQQPHRPALPSRRGFRAGQGGEPGIKCAVKAYGSGLALGFAQQGRFKTLLYKTLLEMFNGPRRNPQGRRHFGDLPGIAGFTGIAQEQGARMNELRRRGFAASSQLRELLPFRPGQGEFISVSHAQGKPLSRRNAIRK